MWTEDSWQRLFPALEALLTVRAQSGFVIDWQSGGRSEDRPVPKTIVRTGLPGTLPASLST